MKKLYFFLMAIMVAFCAHADYYLVGGFNGWNVKDNNYRFTAVGDGTYTLTVAKLSGEFKISQGAWVDSQNFASNGSAIQEGVVYNLGGGGGANISIAGGQAIANALLTLNPTAKTLLISGQSQEEIYTYCLHGSFSGSWADVTLTESDGKWVANDVVAAAQAQFGIKQVNSAGAQAAWYAADGNATINAAGEYKIKKDGTNFTIAKGTWGFSFDPKTLILTVTGDNGGGGDDPTPDVDYTKWYFNVPGDFNDNMDNGVVFNADGTATQSNLPLGNGKFRLKIWNGTQDLYLSGGEYSETDGAFVVNAGEPVIVQDNVDNNMIVAGAQEGDTFNVTYDAVNNEMTVTPVDYSNHYVNVIGDFNGWQDNGIQPGTGDAEHSYEVLFKELPIGTSGFKVKIWNGSTDEYHSNGQALTPWMWTAIPGNTDANMTIAGATEGQTYNLRYNLRTNEIVVWDSTQSGIEGVAAEVAEAVYYNLQGVKVATPAAGIYIKVVGNKATKVAVK